MDKLCVICKRLIDKSERGWDGGYNAEPVAVGQCCYTCDKSIVIPARMSKAGYSSTEILTQLRKVDD